MLQGLYKLDLNEVNVCSEIKSNYFSIKGNESNNAVSLINNYTKGGISEQDECHITLLNDLGDDVSVSRVKAHPPNYSSFIKSDKLKLYLAISIRLIRV